MPTMKLTQIAVDRLSPPKTGRLEFFDTHLPGFGLRIADTGHKAWVVFYRISGRQRRYTIGTCDLPQGGSCQRAGARDPAGRGARHRSGRGKLFPPARSTPSRRWPRSSLRDTPNTKTDPGKAPSVCSRCMSCRRGEAGGRLDHPPRRAGADGYAGRWRPSHRGKSGAGRRAKDVRLGRGAGHPAHLACGECPRAGEGNRAGSSPDGRGTEKGLGGGRERAACRVRSSRP